MFIAHQTRGHKLEDDKKGTTMRCQDILKFLHQAWNNTLKYNYFSNGEKGHDKILKTVTSNHEMIYTPARTHAVN